MFAKGKKQYNICLFRKKVSNLHWLLSLVIAMEWVCEL